MRIYLDNNATSPLHPEVLARLTRELGDNFGNASSVHAEGQRARRTLEEAREAISALLHASPRQVVFTSGGTEANNLALFGAASDRCHIVTSAIEHPSVLQVCSLLEQRGHEVTRVAPRGDGQIDVEAFVSALRADTRVATLMLANNETGVIQPVREVARACRERGIHFHCDAVQGVGKIDVDVEALGVDTLALSGHKLHAPKGIGALYVRAGVTLASHIVGGAQERRRRAGTENVPLAAALGTAAQLVSPEINTTIAARRDAFEQRLREALSDGVAFNGVSGPRLPNTSSVVVRGVDAEGLVIGLDLEGIALSTGAACSSGRVEPSHVLLAMGLSVEDARSSVRVSLSRFNAAEELDVAAATIARLAPLHRRRTVAAERSSQTT